MDRHVRMRHVSRWFDRGVSTSCRYLAVGLSTALASAAFGQAPVPPLDRLDRLPRQGTSDAAITPVFGQIVLYALPDEFRAGAGGVARKGRYVQQSVLANETVQRWTQRITLAGDEALAFSGLTYPQKMSDDYGARMKKNCPGSYSALPLPGAFVGSYDTVVVVFACGTAGGGQSESVLQLIVKGGMDIYTLEWAVRGPPSRGPLQLDEVQWTERLRRLAPIRVCAVVANEPPPYPSCLQRR